MQTNLNTQGQAGPAPAAAVAANVANGTPSELFTTLLVAQIRNQNPLEPTDPSEFVGQLTQLSQMEALQKLVAHGNASASMLESLQLTALGAQVGSRIAVRSGGVAVGAERIEGRVMLESGAARVTLVLQSPGGPEHRIELGTHGAGEVAFAIEPGRVPPGAYAMRVETDGGDAPQIDVFGELRSVKVSPNGGVALDVGGLGAVPASQITGFNGRKSEQSS
ncbi:flagellar hook capping FlgD N-terminal domain-containing protein [Aromatoleum sp.]|uniref:flagellar hook capping FlgD N-terminal domain-containing protein n=1 Tax=Aromatoleum sp. TaxID=2307007 RepID=UPI002FC71C7E